MTSVPQFSLTGGELSPGLWGRVDLARYQSCLETARNVIIQPYGGIKNRAGFEYLGAIKSHSVRARLIPFIYSETNSYVLEFGPGYIRFWYGGTQVTGTSAGTWSSGTSYQSYGLIVLYNGVYYYNLVVPNLNNNPASSPTYWHPLSGLIVELPTSFTAGELDDISIAQSGDVIFLAHQNHAPLMLSRISYASWLLRVFPFVNGPFSVLNPYTLSDKLTITAVTGSITIVNTGSSNVFKTTQVGQLIYIESENYGTPWQAGTAYGAAAIVRSDGKYYQTTAGGTAGTVRPVHLHGDWSDGGVTWTYLNSGYGIALITGMASSGVYATVITRFPEDLISNGSAFWSIGDWAGGDGYPGSVAIHQQRLCFGGSPSFPETIWMSKTGNYYDFGTSAPVQDDDSLSLTLAASTRHEVKGLLSLNTLLITTSGGAWALGTGDQEAITPTNVGAKLQTFRGAAKIDPLGVGRSCIYLQDKGQIIRDLSYDSAGGGYQAYDLTTLASHLFDGYAITEWAWQESPFQTLWALRSDGILLSCVYAREQEVLGWAQHDTQGLVESVCVVPEGNEHVVYIEVIRPIDGAFYRFIERMASRQVLDINQAFFVDSGRLFDNSYLGSAFVVIWNGTNWDENEQLNCTASSSIFAGATDIGDQIVFVLDDGSKLRFTIEEVLSGTVARVRSNRTVPTGMRGADLYGWNWARDTFSMPHLIGETVSILADGVVQTEQEVPADGYVVLDPPARYAVIGLPYDSDIKTLDPAINSPETAMDKWKNITQVRFMVRESRGIKAGRSFDDLFEWTPRNFEPYDDAPNLQSGVVTIAIACTWEPRGAICLRQDDPLPINWIALVPDVQAGGKLNA